MLGPELVPLMEPFIMKVSLSSSSSSHWKWQLHVGNPSPLGGSFQADCPFAEGCLTLRSHSPGARQRGRQKDPHSGARLCSLPLTDGAWWQMCVEGKLRELPGLAVAG